MKNVWKQNCMHFSSSENSPWKASCYFNRFFFNFSFSLHWRSSSLQTQRWLRFAQCVYLEKLVGCSLFVNLSSFSSFYQLYSMPLLYALLIQYSQFNQTLLFNVFCDRDEVRFCICSLLLSIFFFTSKVIEVFECILLSYIKWIIFTRFYWLWRLILMCTSLQTAVAKAN